MFCNKCGNKLHEGAGFCQGCGATVASKQVSYQSGSKSDSASLLSGKGFWVVASVVIVVGLVFGFLIINSIFNSEARVPAQGFPNFWHDSLPATGSGSGHTINATFGSVFQYENFEIAIADYWILSDGGWRVVQIPFSATNNGSSSNGVFINFEMWCPGGISRGGAAAGIATPDMRPGVTYNSNIIFMLHDYGVYTLENNPNPFGSNTDVTLTFDLR
jgi:hypothetical protein